MYFLDTDIIIFWLNGNYEIGRKIDTIGSWNIITSFVNLSELYYGVYKSNFVKYNLSKLKIIENTFNIYSLDYKTSKEFGKIKANLSKKGQIISDADIFIASICLINNFILVTNNEQHFDRIENLEIEN